MGKDSKTQQDSGSVASGKEIIINSTLNEIRVALTNRGKLVELFWELPDKERHIGNIYLGKVQRIVQGMNAAFIDIGMKQDAFLHFSDVSESLEEETLSMLGEDESPEEGDEIEDSAEGDEEEIDAPEVDPTDKIIADYKGEISENAQLALRHIKTSAEDNKLPTFDTKRSGKVTINLKEGQPIIVQATREAYDQKGIRVSTHISIPGRYVVLCPFNKVLGVSKKIYNSKERRRLRSTIRRILPRSVGCIVRTEAEGATTTALRKDLKHLLSLWADIEKMVITGAPPLLLNKDADLARSLIRDLFSDDFTRVVVDSKKLFDEIMEYVEWASPKLANKIVYYKDPQPVFAAAGIEDQVNNVYSRTVQLPSGGSIVFDHTEAMVIVDVNSGRYAERSQQELNSLKTNLEAAREIATQIRLRDIGGMVVIDFIDLLDDRNKKKLYEEMRKSLRYDRAKTVVFPLSQLGLMQITRQRIRKNIMQMLTEPCNTCKGSGHVPSKLVVINQVEHWLRQFRGQSKEFRLRLVVNPSVAFHLQEGDYSRLTRLMIRYFVQLRIEPNPQLAITEFKVYSVRTQKEITRKFEHVGMVQA